MSAARTLVFFKSYFKEFFRAQDKKVQGKILWTLKVIEQLERIPHTYLKHMEGTDGLYEIRVQSGSDIFRIFCFFDKGNLVVLCHGFQKKSQQTPRKEIERALRIKQEYHEEQKESDHPR
jgi:phage-related protein